MRSVVAVVALISCVHAGLWTLLHQQQSVPNIDGPLASVSYAPYTRWQDPERGDRPTAEQIRSDLRLLSPYTRTVRTYSSTGGVELVPSIAAEETYLPDFLAASAEASPRSMNAICA